MAIHGTFTTDFFSLVFILEAFYQFINKEKDKTFAFISFIVAELVKQSSIFYVIPVFLYLIFKNFKNIKWKTILVFLLFASSFFYKLYREVSNPLPVCFFNFLFNSPLCVSKDSFVLDTRFGGINL